VFGSYWKVYGSLFVAYRRLTPTLGLFRNGGHITPVLYGEYTDLKKEYGKETAKKIIRFRLAHLSEYLAVAEEEGLMKDSQCREVDAFDVYQDPTLFQKAKSLLATYREDLPEESKHYKTYEDLESIKVC
jgi:hypothetical protein